MASGDTILPRSALSVGILLLDAVATGSLNNGVWVDCQEFRSGTVVVTGGATTTVTTLMASNALAQPSAATAGPQIDATSAGADKFMPVTQLPRWIKAAVTATGTGTVTAILVARRA